MAAKALAPEKLDGGDNTAAILAIGTANPKNVVPQSDFPDYFFRLTGNDDNTALKEKFRALCNKSTIQKRHIHLTEAMVNQNPNMSLNARQDIVVSAVPELAASAAEEALAEWGRPRSEITHMIFCTVVGADMPGADHRLLRLLDLQPTVQRFMFYHLGCYASGAALRLSKDIAENNPGARVLVVCSEVFSVHYFRAPELSDHLHLLLQSVFGDAAAAVVVGSDRLLASGENPLFKIVSGSQFVIDGTASMMEAHVREAGGGISFELDRSAPETTVKGMEEKLREAGVLESLSVSDRNELFWVVHPASDLVLELVKEEFMLGPDKLEASARVLLEYGYVLSCSSLFSLQETRRRSTERRLSTTGEGLEYGVLFCFGPGITIEMVVLRSTPLSTV